MGTLLDLFNRSRDKSLLASAHRTRPKGKQQARDHEDNRQISRKFLQHLSCRRPEHRIAGIAAEGGSKAKTLAFLDENDKAKKSRDPKKQKQGQIKDECHI